MRGASRIHVAQHPKLIPQKVQELTKDAVTSEIGINDLGLSCLKLWVLKSTIRLSVSTLQIKMGVCAVIPRRVRESGLPGSWKPWQGNTCVHS